MTEIQTQTVMAPFAEVWIAGEQVDARVSRYRAGKSIIQPGGVCEVTLAHPEGVSSPALDAFLAASPKEKPLTQIKLGLGYRGLNDGEPYGVFTGYIQKAEALHDGRILKILALDDLPLRNLIYKKGSLSVKLSEDISEIVVKAGIAEHWLNLPNKTFSHRIQNTQTAFDLLASLRKRALLPYPWYFDANGLFLWTPWEAEDQAETPVYRYQTNIVLLKPSESDLSGEDDRYRKSPLYKDWKEAQPKGPVYELETIPAPWLYAGQVVRVEKHPKAASGDYRIDSLVHKRGGGQTRTVAMIRRIAV